MNRNGKSVETTTSSDNVQSKTKSPEIFVKDLTQARDNINMMREILKENVEKNSVSSKLSPEEIEKTKHLLQKDIAQYNQDIKLLSLLVGKQFTSQDIDKLATTNLGKISIRPPSPTRSMTTQRTSLPSIPIFTKIQTTTIPNIPSFKPLNDKESQFLIALEQIKSTTTSTTTQLPTTLRKSITQKPKSQEALIAAYLKQQGIGPNSQIPLDVSSLKS